MENKMLPVDDEEIMTNFLIWAANEIEVNCFGEDDIDIKREAEALVDDVIANPNKLDSGTTAISNEDFVAALFAANTREDLIHAVISDDEFWRESDARVEREIKRYEMRELERRIDRDEAKKYGLTLDQLTETLEAALNGKTVSQVRDGQRTFNVVLRLAEDWRAETGDFR